jgi:nudix-type nucleoside diphosphatase (YffH/AdpP family)
MAEDLTDRVRIRDVKILSDKHYTLRETEFDYRRRDGAWQSLSRETFDRGHAAAVLPIDKARGTVLLIKQFRLPPYETGYRQALIEVIAGGLDGDDAETCARKEAREEAGLELGDVKEVFHCFMSPGAVSERMHLLVATYSAASRTSSGGGLAHEGEDIEVIELPLALALEMIASGDICDAKTIILLQYAAMQKRVAGE